MYPETFAKDPYKILQVSFNSEPEVIAAAYRSLARKYHPDANPESVSGERMRAINWAYEILSDPQKRTEYDRARTASGSSPSPEPEAWAGWSERGRARQYNRYTYEELLRRNMICQECGKIAATKDVQFDQNIGLLFMRRYSTVKGKLCRACIEKHFWETTGKMILFGWWGIISFFVTCFFLIKNVLVYLSSLNLQSNKVSMWKQALAWKFVVFAIIGECAIYYVGFQGNPGPSIPVTGLGVPGGSKSTAGFVLTPAPASLLPFLPTPTPSSCLSASEISLRDVGRSACIVGTVIRSYDQPNGRYQIFYLVFSRRNEDFYMVSYNDHYNGIDGNCVMANGKIDQIGNAPVMVIDKNLYNCN